MLYDRRKSIRRIMREIRSKEKEHVSVSLTSELLDRVDEERGKYRLNRSAFIEWVLREKLMGGLHY